jgi:AcrR family transcriptional regulator
VGRPARFDSEEILDAAIQLIAERGLGQTTVSEIARRLGAPTGSIYHRFESKDLLLAHLWMRTVRRAQAGFLRALGGDDLEAAARDAALHMLHWSREHRAEASLLLLHRAEDLAHRWPEELGEEASSVNDEMREAVRGFTRRRFGRLTPLRLQAVTFALVDVPYAACRRYLLAGQDPPPSLDGLVVLTCECTLFASAGNPKGPPFTPPAREHSWRRRPPS